MATCRSPALLPGQTWTANREYFLVPRGPAPRLFPPQEPSAEELAGLTDEQKEVLIRERAQEARERAREARKRC